MGKGTRPLDRVFPEAARRGSDSPLHGHADALRPLTGVPKPVDQPADPGIVRRPGIRPAAPGNPV